MAAIPGSVRVTGFIAPTDTADTYPSHDATYGRGGMRSVADLTERNAIPADRRQAGMLVYVSSNTTTYQLNQPPWNFTNTDWTAFPSGGGGTLAGDATGPIGANTVARIQNIPVTLFSPTNGQVLTYVNDGETPPYWSNVSGGGGGTLAGDVTGAIGANTAVRIQNRNVASTAPSNNQVLAWNNGFSRWEPADISNIYFPPPTPVNTTLVNARLAEVAVSCSGGSSWEGSYGIYLSSLPRRVGFCFANNLLSGSVNTFTCGAGTALTIPLLTPGSLDVYSEMYVMVRTGFTGATSPTISIGTTTDQTRWVNGLSLSSTGTTYINLVSLLSRNIDGPDFGLTGNLSVRFNVASGTVSSLVGRVAFSFVAEQRASNST